MMYIPNQGGLDRNKRVRKLAIMYHYPYVSRGVAHMIVEHFQTWQINVDYPKVREYTKNNYIIRSYNQT